MSIKKYKPCIKEYASTGWGSVPGMEECDEGEYYKVEDVEKLLADAVFYKGYSPVEKARSCEFINGRLELMTYSENE